ncbi:MAG TPA: AMP-binding protein [Burkholderiaceae bacterium]|nr:AMP-binding protein [Burkholderiaceae bacterium]
MSARPALHGAAGDPADAFDDAARTLAWRDGEAITLAQCLAEAAAFAERLPPHGQPVNLCRDRYLFTLALLAAMQRGQTSLMPPNAMPHTLRQLEAVATSPLYALIDDPVQDTAGLPSLVVQRPATRDALAWRPQPQQWVARLLTSGSTGEPQPQLKRWDALRRSIRAEAASLSALLGWPTIAGLHLVATVPPQHSYGLESSVLLALLGGASFDAGRPFYPADIADALARLPRPRALVTTPVHLKALLGSGVALPPVDLVLSATAPLSPQLAQQAEACVGGRLIEIYGCTEAGQVAARRTTDGDVWTTLEGLRIEAQRTNADAERFVVSGGHVLEPTPLADRLQLLDAQHFRLLGRANDLINVAGKRNSLAHLNFHLNRIDGVRDGVFWLPDDVPEAVVRLVAFVVAPSLGARQIVAALRTRVEGAFLPRRVIHVEALPRDATGKITAQALREFALRTLAPDRRSR